MAKLRGVANWLARLAEIAGVALVLNSSHQRSYSEIFERSRQRSGGEMD